MVIFLFFFLSLATLQLQAAPTVDASIDSMNAQAHYPLQGSITITHKKDEKIDPSSFEIEGKKLDVSFSRELLISAASDSLIAIYHFELPPKEKGLYLLPEIKVKVNGKVYQSIGSSYEVHEEAPQPAPSVVPSGPQGPLIFRLEAAIKGPSVLYPGERTILFYRILYNRNIDLTKSVLPMIHPAHFQKVGDVQIKDYQEKEATVQELSQEVEASEFGTFQFGLSVIEGYAYQLRGSQKEYDNTLLHAEAASLTVEVKPFPKEDQPPSFAGAIGKIEAEGVLQSSPNVFVGDTLQLLITINGIENLTELHLPLLSCQPGISGFFQTSDLPPPSEVVGTSKVFHVELRPMTALTSEIPPLELSSFDPKSGKYVTVNLPAVPIHVEGRAASQPTQQNPLIAIIPKVGTWPEPSLSPLSINLQPVELQAVKSSWINSNKVFWVIPLALLLFVMQIFLKKELAKRPYRVAPQSEKLFKEGLKQDFAKSSKGLFLLEEAFWHRLWENGALKKGSFDLKEEHIRKFILKLQALQYSQHKDFNPQEIKKEARDLFYRI